MKTRILQEAINCVKPGGFIIYSTCTYNPDENIHQIINFNKVNFTSIPFPSLKSYNFEEIHLKECFGYQAFPHKVKGEGFFISILQKEKTAGNSYPYSKIINLNWQKYLTCFTGPILRARVQALVCIM